MHFQLRSWHDATQWALHSATFYFLNSVRALWEEHRVTHLLAQSNHETAGAELPDQLTLPEFILECAEEVLKER